MERELSPTADLLLELERCRRQIALQRRADQIATRTDLESLGTGVLAFFAEVANAEQAVLFLLDTVEQRLVVSQLWGSLPRQLLGRTVERESSLAGYTLHEGRPIWTADPQTFWPWPQELAARPSGVQASCCLPLISLGAEAVGVVQLLNPLRRLRDDPAERDLLAEQARRLAGDLAHARRAADGRRREQRQQALVETIASLTTMLDRQQLLSLIMEQARTLLDAEATSIFTIDKSSGELVPHVATGTSHERLQGLRVPKGHGIVGYVAETGERVHVRDVRSDPRHYSAADSQTGFTTRAILAVPLRAQAIRLGGERGQIEQQVIGVAEALNKRDNRTFDDEDVQLFETLANQAATVLQVAALVDELNELFIGVIAAFSASVDARDPYTQGHSLRVADFASAIARELGLSTEAVHHVRIGGLLHDIGKIGVPDAILNKPGRLTEEEYACMRDHPLIGERMMQHIPVLSESLAEVMNALLEHHERLDGRGYPRGLRDDEISQIGRIMGVADVFDALTSDRPYRSALSVEHAFRILQAGAGHEFDPACVQAIIAARHKGAIQVQGERADPNK